MVLLAWARVLSAGAAFVAAIRTLTLPWPAESAPRDPLWVRAMLLIALAGVAVGVLFFLRDRRSGWPFLAAALCFPLNEAIRALLTRYDLIDPLTAFVGSLSQPLTFLASFAMLFVLLASTALPVRGNLGSPGRASAAMSASWTGHNDFFWRNLEIRLQV